MDGARGVLFNITGGHDLTMNEVDDAAKIISEAADPDANIIFGTTIDEAMKDQIKITVIATGFDQTKQKLKEFLPPSKIPTAVSTAENTPKLHMRHNEENDEKNEDMWDIPAFLRQKN